MYRLLLVCLSSKPAIKLFGAYFSYGVAKAGQNNIADWEGIDENYVLFPTDDSQDIYRDVNNNFKNFKQDVDKYFSNYTSVIGTGFYRNKQIQNLSIEIPIQFFGKAEIIGFTQYLTGILINQFDNIHVEVSVTSVNGPEALIIKRPMIRTLTCMSMINIVSLCADYIFIRWIEIEEHNREIETTLCYSSESFYIFSESCDF